MKAVVEGFNLEVTVKDFQPQIRVALADGQEVVNTNAVSATGLARLSKVFEVAAVQAAQELGRAYHAAHVQATAAIEADRRVP